MPVLLMVVKYRKPNWLWNIFKKQPNATLIIGKPMIADKSLDIKQRQIDMCNRCRLSMINMLGLNEISNEELRKSLPTYEVEDISLFK